MLLAGTSHQAFAQKKAAEAPSYLPFFTVQDNLLVVRNGDKAKSLDKDITLPNGVRVEHRSQSVLLTNGTRMPLREGDMLSLNGEFIRKAPTPSVVVATTEAAAPVVAAEAVPAPAAVAAPVAPAAAPAPAVFTYRPAAPVNGRLKGVVELGASGFNLFIIRVDEKRNWKLEKSEFGNSLVMENMATEADVRHGLKTYIGQMLDFGVAGRDIHFVVSSGALMATGTQSIIKGLEAFKYKVTTVTPEREGVLGLVAALPTGYADNAFVVDMGSGNTKNAWMAGGKPHVVDTYGAKYYERSIDATAVATDVRAKAVQVPAELRKTCFIIGGVPYELAKAGRQGKEPFTVLRASETYSQLPGAKTQAGLNIYQSVAGATGCQQFVFGYDANFTIGYLLTLP